ncbi:multidrug resistance protein fnx1 [Physcia stellaris]|nr:multidrug resistance protein fnx1 [Physcia stellaris]
MALKPNGDQSLLPSEYGPADSTDEETALLGAANGEQTASEGEPSSKRPALIVGTTFVGVFLGALDMTIIATLAAPISISFGSLSLISWVASAYIIANAASQPLLGRLTDIYGRRNGLIVSNVLFTTGNLICGLSTDQGVMILGRAVAGLGGGGLMAISNFIASDLVPLRKRGTVQGMSNLIYGVGNGLGGFVGGFINDTWGWRVAFLIQVPPALVSTILVFVLVAVPPPALSKQSKLSRVDFPGALTLTTTLILLLLGLNLGGGTLGFGDPLVLGLFILSVLSLCAFVWIEVKWAKEPIFPVQLMLERTIVMAKPQQLVYLDGGLRGADLYSDLVPSKYRVFGVSLMGIFVLGSGVLLFLDSSSPVWLATISLSMIGFGYGGIITVNLLANISSLGHEFQAVITSSIYVFRSTGSAIGVTVASVVY